jgi:glycosyltransferase involved in cell wall biosynthesis
MKVTVAIRTFNRPDLFKEALASIQLQSHTDWEVIIFDDGATDINFNIYKKFKETNPDKKVLYLTTNEPRGLYKPSWLIAPDLANGEIIVRLDDDDLLAEDCLEFLSKVYTENPELDFSYGSSVSFNDENNINPILKDRMITINVKGYKLEEKIIIARDYLMKEILKEHNIISYEKYNMYNLKIENYKEIDDIFKEEEHIIKDFAKYK